MIPNLYSNPQMEVILYQEISVLLIEISQEINRKTAKLFPKK